MKYTQSCDAIAYRSIALTGSDQSAWESLGITNKTFYKWMARHDTFRTAVERAKDFHSRASPEALRLGIITYIANVLEAGGEVVMTHQRVTKRTVQRDRHNQVMFSVDEETSTETTEKKGIPKWIADKIMANASGLSEAITKVISSGRYEVVEIDKALPAGDDDESETRTNGHRSENT